ncbi:hypothetical protein psyc5s11_21340 [Clostridium gelidum]|uniref:HNH nuclease domain-containing protein n=1 Tax=Clostridium gelidum TaxID=704125 RepID=A0ABN6J013_9CLOT|nr:hypothetical protein [Clostridium gelidum]BCZ46067.1 hypothetical protein psyc5s11_21340 [Clostridium gelidum]
MILINKKCFDNEVNLNIDGKKEMKHLKSWYQPIMVNKIETKYNNQGKPSSRASKDFQKEYLENEKYIIDNIIPFFKKENGYMDRNLISILLLGDFIGNLVELSEKPPSEDFGDYWLKIISYYAITKFVFYDLGKMKNNIINSTKKKKVNQQKCIEIIEDIYNAKIKAFNSNHKKFKIIPETLSIEYECLTKWDKKFFINKSIIDIKKKICIELQEKEKFYTNCFGNVNKLGDIEKFNRMLKFFISYEMLDDKQRHIILNALDVSVCPYCNRQYITSYEPSEKGKNKIETLATADLDHFYPKAKFQLFSLSLYNFVPACQICNSRMKIDRPIEILYPYAECFGDEVKFEVIPVDEENEGKALFDLLYGRDDTLKSEKYRININRSNISDKIKEKHIEGSIEMFQLENVYQSHKEYAAQIIRTKAIYDNPVYESVMNTLFNNEFPLGENRNISVKAILSHLEEKTPEELSENEKNRILYGIDTEDKNQDLKKPLVKLTRDILDL